MRDDLIRIIVPAVILNGLVFAALVFAIKRLLLGDTMKAVDTIKKVETDVRKKEEQVKREIEDHERQFAQRKEESEQELRRQRESSEKEIAKMKEQTLAESKQEAESIIERARRSEERFRLQIAQELQEKTVQFASRIFTHVFTERIDGVLNAQLIDELLMALEAVDGEVFTVNVEEVTVTSSHALNGEQKERLCAVLRNKFGADFRVKEETDPALLGGMVLRLGSLEIDGSLKNRFAEAMQEVAKESVVGVERAAPTATG